jgi:hypothetical protein
MVSPLDGIELFHQFIADKILILVVSVAFFIRHGRYLVRSEFHLQGRIEKGISDSDEIQKYLRLF